MPLFSEDALITEFQLSVKIEILDMAHVNINLLTVDMILPSRSHKDSMKLPDITELMTVLPVTITKVNSFSEFVKNKETEKEGKFRGISLRDSTKPNILRTMLKSTTTSSTSKDTRTSPSNSSTGMRAPSISTNTLKREGMLEFKIGTGQFPIFSSQAPKSTTGEQTKDTISRIKKVDVLQAASLKNGDSIKILFKICYGCEASTLNLTV